tara:strand:- start:69 stop:2033 length:1965 start_codon:yes stop_codon:yes gene_type:complete
MANDFSELLKAQKETNKQLQHLRKEVAKDEPFAQSDEAKGVAAHMVAKKVSGETEVDNLVEKLNKDQQERNQALIDSITNAIGGKGGGTGNPNIPSKKTPSQKKEDEKNQKGIFSAILASFQKLGKSITDTVKAPFSGAMSGVIGIFTFLSALFKALAATGVLLGLRELLLKVDGEKFAKIVLDIFDLMEEKFNKIKNYFKEVMDTYENEGFVAAAKKIFDDFLCLLPPIFKNFFDGVFKEFNDAMEVFNQEDLGKGIEKFKENFPEFSKSFQNILFGILGILGVTGVGTYYAGKFTIMFLFKTLKKALEKIGGGLATILGVNATKPTPSGQGAGVAPVAGATPTVTALSKPSQPKAFLGKKVGDIVEVREKGGMRYKEITGISKAGTAMSGYTTREAFLKQQGNASVFNRVMRNFPNVNSFFTGLAKITGKVLGPGLVVGLGLMDAFNVLDSDMEAQKKKKELMKILGGTVGTLGGAAIGFAFGGLPGSLITSLIGYYGGDYFFGKMADFFLGNKQEPFSQAEIEKAREEEASGQTQQKITELGSAMQFAEEQMKRSREGSSQFRQAQQDYNRFRKEYDETVSRSLLVQEMEQRDRELQAERSDNISDLANILTVGNVSNDNSSNVNNYNMNLQRITNPDMLFQSAAIQTGPT